MSSPEFIECALWTMQHGRMRITPKCERPHVRFGTESCGHFVGTPQIEDPKARDVSDICQRSQKARKLPSIDESLS